MSHTTTATVEKVQTHAHSKTLTLGPVELNVRDLSKMKQFYHAVMGLEVISENVGSIVLGKGKNALVVLHRQEDLTHAPPTHAGLYHFALLFSSRKDLAHMIKRIIESHPRLFSGSADHLVSEAFYFTDPEGNGIELYVDRDRALWQWENKQIKMAALFLDPKSYIEKYLLLEESAQEVQMGHFHLKVGDIKAARKFYVDILGFEITAELPGALFISRDGYHHHLGMNTWESIGARMRLPSLGLRKISLQFSQKKDFERVYEQLKGNGVTLSEKSNSISFHDPWKNELVISYVS